MPNKLQVRSALFFLLSGSVHTEYATFFKFQYVEMPIVSRPDCQEDYSGVNGVDDGMICAGIDEGGEIIPQL